MNFMVIFDNIKLTCKKVVIRSSSFISDPMSCNIWRRVCLSFTKSDKANEDWVNYVERMTLFFEANGIEEETKRKVILLSSVGAQTYKLLKSLSVPSKPAHKTFQELVRMMTNHQDPKPNSIAERFKLNNRDRKLEESIAKYTAELRHLTEHCNYDMIFSIC